MQPRGTTASRPSTQKEARKRGQSVHVRKNAQQLGLGANEKGRNSVLVDGG
jgi:anti-sigma28 factor (negative regulator of flagellin synthesis)